MISSIQLFRLRHSPFDIQVSDNMENNRWGYSAHCNRYFPPPAPRKNPFLSMVSASGLILRIYRCLVVSDSGISSCTVICGICEEASL